jgi:membrane protease YdiL (CAAX protease family)
MKSPPLKNVIAVLIATTAALFARAWLQVRLPRDGVDASVASDLAYLAVIPIFLLLLFPVLASDREFIRRQFLPGNLSLRVIILAIAVGFFLRLAWHAHIVAGVSLGYYSIRSEVTINSPVIAFNCPATHLLALTIVVYSLFIPIIEELTHRAYVQSYFLRFGPIIGITASTAVFTIFHNVPGWDFVAFCGVILGTMYWLTRSLWAPVIAHAVVNFLPQLTLRCLSVQWNPAPDVTPIWRPGLAFAAISCVSAMLMLVSLIALRTHRGANGPGAS